jgi:hypothetical protein
MRRAVTGVFRQVGEEFSVYTTNIALVIQYMTANKEI